MAALVSDAPASEATFDLDDAQHTFEATCSQCHESSDVEFASPESEEEARALVTRMVVETVWKKPKRISKKSSTT